MVADPWPLLTQWPLPFPFVCAYIPHPAPISIFPLQDTFFTNTSSMFLYKPALCLYPLVFCSCRKLNTFSTDSLHWLAVKPEVAEIGAVALVW